jgi:hypothetical protein
MRTARLSSLALWMAATVAGAAPTIDRYQEIVKRSPFGKAESGGPLTAAAASFLARYAFVGVIGSSESPATQIAIILDKTTNASHFKTPGETVGDLTVERIEETQPKRRLWLRHGIETGALVFGEGAPASSVPTAATAQTPIPGMMPHMTPGPQPPVGFGRRVPFSR